MNDGQLKDATARLRKIEGVIGDLAAKQRATETKLRIERETVSKLVGQRDELISELGTANEEQAKAVHRKLDTIEPQITKTTRLSKATSTRLKTLSVRRPR